MMKNLIAIILFLTSFSVFAKEYKGAELRTHESFLYGRFESRFKPANRSGVVSSLFTYHEISNTSDWNEIDIEFVGRYDDNIQINIISALQKNHVRSQYIDFNPYEDYHNYAFEWTPDYVAWLIDDVEFFRFEGEVAALMNLEQKFMMNIWPPGYENWVGPFDENSLPAFSFYDWASYSSYTPGSGNTGTNNNFTLQWKDEFDSYNSERWGKGTHTWNGNNCDFVSENAHFANGNLILCLTPEGQTGYQDQKAPKLKWIRNYSDTGKLTAHFSEELDETSAETKTNYTISGVTINSATLSVDKKSVELSVSNYQNTTAQNLIIMNIKDLLGNTGSVGVVTIPALNYLGVNGKINIGGDADFGYTADQEWNTSKTFGYSEGSKENWPENILINGTDEDLVFVNERKGTAKYTIYTINGDYKVKLLFAEKYFNSANGRVFDIYIENQLVEDNFDIYAEAGINNALIKEYVIPIADESIDIYFCGITDSPIFAGVQYERMSSGIGNNNEKPKTFELYQNYPNPFFSKSSTSSAANSTTKIKFNIPEQENLDLSNAKLGVYNSIGQKVADLINSHISFGDNEIDFSAENLSAGIYFYKLVLNGQVQTKKMIFIK
jgi:hypothetical protein